MHVLAFFENSVFTKLNLFYKIKVNIQYESYTAPTGQPLPKIQIALRMHHTMLGHPEISSRSMLNN